VKATGVIARFLSLLDVALILLGLLMIMLTQAQLRSKAKSGSTSSDSIAALAGVDFIYLYAGWKGSENGRCYLLSANLTLEREVRTDTAADIQAILAARKGQKERSNPVVMLLFSEDGWYSAWSPERLSKIEQTWGIKVIPVYNVRLPR
jgi:hypothetical protein